VKTVVDLAVLQAVIDRLAAVAPGSPLAAQ
jgi:hypothetical protein